MQPDKMSETSVHRWPTAALTGDLVRGALATGIMFLFLLVTPVGSLVFWGVAGLTILFALYLMSSVSRITSVIEVNDEGVRLSGGLFGGRQIKWRELTGFQLRHFPLSRDRSRGWMDLKLKGGGQTIAIDDRLDRFGEVLARAWTAARAAEIGISDATHHNLIAAGLVAKAKA
jgi:uncharacterized membrane protein